MKAWHFIGDTLRDGRPVPADGITLRHDGPLLMCRSGLHASLHPWDALKYAPGSTLCLVEAGGETEHEPDKLVCMERTIIARMGAEPLLRYFARQQALSVVHLWNAPQEVLDYLMGDDDARDATRDAARAAARAAALDASWDAARDAAFDAARAAALGAAMGAVRAAASNAALGAARDAARDAARAAARADFACLVNDAFGDWI